MKPPPGANPAAAFDMRVDQRLRDWPPEDEPEDLPPDDDLLSDEDDDLPCFPLDDFELPPWSFFVCWFSPVGLLFGMGLLLWGCPVGRGCTPRHSTARDSLMDAATSAWRRSVGSASPASAFVASPWPLPRVTASKRAIDAWCIRTVMAR